MILQLIIILISTFFISTILGILLDKWEEKAKLKRTIAKKYLEKIIILDEKISYYNLNNNYRAINSCKYHKLKYLDKANIFDKKAREEILKYCIWPNPNYTNYLKDLGWIIK